MKDTQMGRRSRAKVVDGGFLTFHFGFDLGDPLGKLLLEVEGLQPLLVVVDPAGGGENDLK